MNVKRGVERRRPQVINGLNQPFNPDLFNFTKIKSSEILFEMCPSSRDQGSPGGLEEKSDGTKLEKEKEHERNLLIINISPLEFCNVLLVPDVNSCTNQVITPKLLHLAIDMMLLSSHPGFRVGFNSLCAFASVNHQHIHAYYCNHEFYIEYAQVKEVKDGLYELLDTPARGFAFQLDEMPLETLIMKIFSVTEYFKQQNIAHNMMLVRGPKFGEDKSSKNRTIRINLWPRKPVYAHIVFESTISRAATSDPGAKDDSIVNIAVAELAGHLPIKVSEGFNEITEEQIEGSIQEASISEQEFEEIKLAVKKMEP